MSCFGGLPAHDGNFVFELPEPEVTRFKKALADILTGEGEPDYRTLREMSVRLRCATRRPKRQGE
jgi:hypothetical protein